MKNKVLILGIIFMLIGLVNAEYSDNFDYYPQYGRDSKHTNTGNFRYNDIPISNAMTTYRLQPCIGATQSICLYNGFIYFKCYSGVTYKIYGYNMSNRGSLGSYDTGSNNAKYDNLICGNDKLYSIATVSGKTGIISFNYSTVNPIENTGNDYSVTAMTYTTSKNLYIGIGDGAILELDENLNKIGQTSVNMSGCNAQYIFTDDISVYAICPATGNTIRIYQYDMNLVFKNTKSYGSLGTIDNTAFYGLVDSVNEYVYWGGAFNNNVYVFQEYLNISQHKATYNIGSGNNVWAILSIFQDTKILNTEAINTYGFTNDITTPVYNVSHIAKIPYLTQSYIYLNSHEGLFKLDNNFNTVQSNTNAIVQNISRFIIGDGYVWFYNDTAFMAMGDGTTTTTTSTTTTLSGFNYSNNIFYNVTVTDSYGTPINYSGVFVWFCSNFSRTAFFDSPYNGLYTTGNVFGNQRNCYNNNPSYCADKCHLLGAGSTHDNGIVSITFPKDYICNNIVQEIYTTAYKTNYIMNDAYRFTCLDGVANNMHDITDTILLDVNYSLIYVNELKVNLYDSFNNTQLVNGVTVRLYMNGILIDTKNCNGYYSYNITELGKYTITTTKSGYIDSSRIVDMLENLFPDEEIMYLVQYTESSYPDENGTEIYYNASYCNRTGYLINANDNTGIGLCPIQVKCGVSSENPISKTVVTNNLGLFRVLNFIPCGTTCIFTTQCNYFKNDFWGETLDTNYDVNKSLYPENPKFKLYGKVTYKLSDVDTPLKDVIISVDNIVEHYSYSVLTDSDGLYVIDNIPTGNVTIHVRKTPDYMPLSESFNLIGDTEKNYVMSSLQNLYYLAGECKLKEDENTVYSNIKCSVNIYDMDNENIFLITVNSDNNGWFSINLPKGSYLTVAKYKGQEISKPIYLKASLNYIDNQYVFTSALESINESIDAGLIFLAMLLTNFYVIPILIILILFKIGLDLLK